MDDSISPGSPRPTDSPQHTETAPHTEPSRRPGPSFKRLLIVLGGCLLLGGGVQWVSAVNDNSTRNAVSLLAFGIAVVAVLIWTYRSIAVRWSHAAAAVVVVVLLLIPVSLFRLRGFTGEIVPLLEPRFTASRQFRDVAADTARQPVHVAQSDFPQFLGRDRDAVIDRREFDLPADSQLQPLWRQPIGEGWAGFAIAGDRCVTLEQRGSQECVTCYRLGDGALLWLTAVEARHESRVGGDGPRSTPTIADDRVYTQGATGIVQCLDLASGELIWRQDLLELAGWTQSQSEAAISWGRAGSPLLVGQLCVVPFGGPDKNNDDPQPDAAGPATEGRTLIAFDRDDGTVRWSAGDDQISFASPMLMTLASIDQIVSVNEDTVTGHEIEGGTVLWRTRWRGSSSGSANCAAPLAVGGDAFLVGKAYGTGSAVFEVAADEDGLAVTKRWAKPNVLKTKFTHACVAGQVAYGLSDGTLQCVDLTDGRRLWSQPRGDRYGHGQMLLVEDLLVVQTESGRIAFVAASSDQFEELATLPALGSKTWNIPTVAGRYLAVRNDTEAAVYLLPTRDGRDGAETEAAAESETVSAAPEPEST